MHPTCIWLLGSARICARDAAPASLRPSAGQAAHQESDLERASGLRACPSGPSRPGIAVQQAAAFAGPPAGSPVWAALSADSEACAVPADNRHAAGLAARLLDMAWRKLMSFFRFYGTRVHGHVSDGAEHHVAVAHVRTHQCPRCCSPWWRGQPCELHAPHWAEPLVVLWLCDALRWVIWAGCANSVGLELWEPKSPYRRCQAGWVSLKCSRAGLLWGSARARSAVVTSKPR